MNRKSGAPGKVSTFHSGEEQNVPGVTFLMGKTILPLGRQGEARTGGWGRDPTQRASHREKEMTPVAMWSAYAKTGKSLDQELP